MKIELDRDQADLIVIALLHMLNNEKRGFTCALPWDPEERRIARQILLELRKVD